MTKLAPHITAFLEVHLPTHRRASSHTVDSYSLSFELLICFAAEKLRIRPCKMNIEQLEPQLILDFLDSLEKERKNAIRTRNVRLAAFKSFFRYLEYKVPASLELAAKVHAIPFKRCDDALVNYLNDEEIEALLDAPNPKTTTGVRDRAMIHLAYSVGLRVSELVGLMCHDLSQPGLETVHVVGKGRRERIMPLWKVTRRLLRDWLAIRSSTVDNHLFLNAWGKPMTRHGFAHRLAVHAHTAQQKLPSLGEKRISPHVLRHYIECMTMSCNPARFWLYRQVSAAIAT